MKCLFLDIDGVLNRHNAHENGYCGLSKIRMGLLARVVRVTGCRVVISSAWRYLLGEQMNLAGFRNLMLTHGAPRDLTEAVIGWTRRDSRPDEPRMRQIQDWLAENPAAECAVALDDIALGDGWAGRPRVPHVATDGKVGLTVEEARGLIDALARSKWPDRVGVVRYHPAYTHPVSGRVREVGYATRAAAEAVANRVRDPALGLTVRIEISWEPT